MIGDATSDIECGLNLGMDTMLVLTGKGKETQSKLVKFHQPIVLKIFLMVQNK